MSGGNIVRKLGVVGILSIIQQNRVWKRESVYQLKT